MTSPSSCGIHSNSRHSTYYSPGHLGTGKAITVPMLMKLSPMLIALGLALGVGIAHAGTAIVVSVPEQKLAVVRDGERIAQFPVSTSKFGVSDRPCSYGTPLGTLQVAAKI